jgi:hypothetical protein
LSKNSNAGGITIPDFILYCRGKITKTTWCWHKNRHENQYNEIKYPEIKTSRYFHHILGRNDKNIH